MDTYGHMRQTLSRMNRREFLVKASLDAILLASTPSILSSGKKAFGSDLESRTKIACSSKGNIDEILWRCDYNIHTINPDGSGLRQLTNGGQDRYPAWSPDGMKIAYVSGRGGEISVVDIESGIQKVIFSGGSFLLTPTWSPDGTKIAFCSSSHQGGIHTINSDGTNQTFLFDNWYPNWSPDRKKIASATTSGEIFTANIDGSENINITNHPA